MAQMDSPQKSLEVYTIPRLLYGLESVIITPQQLQKMETFHRNILRCLQSLPDRTSVAAIHLLIAIPPMEAILDLRIFSLLWRVAIQQDTPLNTLASRQLATKGAHSKSWFIHADQRLYKYGLPTLIEIMTSPPTKEAWKNITHKTVYAYWDEKLQSQVRQQSSMRYLDVQECSINRIHAVWRDIGCTREGRRAALRAKLLTGTYILQENRARFNQFEVNPTCKMCGAATEDRLHFLIVCSALLPIRSRFMPLILQLLPGLDSMPEDVQMTLLMDTSHFSNPTLEKTLRSYIFALHEARAHKLPVN